MCIYHRVIILNRGSMFAFQRIFPAVKLRLQTPPIDKREIGDVAIPGEFLLSPPPLGPLANERAVSSDVAQSGRENLHQFLPILL